MLTLCLLALFAQPTQSDPSEPGLGITIQAHVQGYQDKELLPMPGIECTFGVGVSEEPNWSYTPVRNRLILGKAVGDKKGYFQATVLVPQDFLDRHPADGIVVWIAPTTPGYRQILRYQPFPSRGHSPIKLQVRLRKGETIRGQVLDSQGSPAGGADVHLYQGRGERRHISRFEADEQGNFEFHIEKPELYDLIARSPGLGSASLTEEAFGFDSPPQDLRLQLSGDGRIEGRLLNPVGEPVRNYRITAFTHGSQHHGSTNDMNAQIRMMDGQARGLHMDSTRTDDEGYFLFTGLMEAEFKFRSPDPDPDRQYHYFDVNPVDTGTIDLRLEFPIHQLLVEIRDHTGQIVKPQLNRGAFFENEHCFFIRYCKEPGLVDPDKNYSSIEAAWSDRGEATVGVVPDEDYLIGVASSKEPLMMEALRIEEDTWVTKRTLQLGKPASRACLKVIARMPGVYSRYENIQYKVTDIKSGLMLCRSNLFMPEPDLETNISAGTYLLEITADPGRGHHGERFGPPDFMPVTQQFTVAPGETKNIDINLKKGGHLRVLVTTKGEPKSLASLNFPLQKQRHSDCIPFRAAHLRLTHKETGDVISPEFDLPSWSFFESEGKYGRYYLSHFFDKEGDWVAEFNRKLSYTLFPPGRYLLEGFSHGYPQINQEIVVIEGRTTDVLLEFEQPEEPSSPGRSEN